MKKSTLGAIFSVVLLGVAFTLGAILVGAAWYMSPPLTAAIIVFWYVKKAYKNREEG